MISKNTSMFLLSFLFLSVPNQITVASVVPLPLLKSKDSSLLLRSREFDTLISHQQDPSSLIDPITTPLTDLSTSATTVLPLAPQKICKETKNDFKNYSKPIVIMLSIDGFRSDYLTKFRPPTLLQLSKKGLYTEGLLPSFPSHTFPNHYSLITGRVPSEHGLLSNKFYDKKRKETYSFLDPKTSLDGSWYGGDPLWNTVVRHGMVAHSYHWVGSEASVNQEDPTCYFKYDSRITFKTKIQQTLNWLNESNETKPHFIALYTSQVDSAGHAYGPNSEQVKNEVLKVDQDLKVLVDFINKSQLPINLIIVSDHGMKEISEKNVITLSDYTNEINQFELSDRGAFTMLYSDDQALIQRTYTQLKSQEKNFKVYLRDEIPAEFKLKNNPYRIGDIVIIADMPYYIIDRNFSSQPPSLNAATHGWSVKNKEMQALFIAYGSHIQKETKIPSFSNTDVYPFVLNLLGLKSNKSHNGNENTLKPYIKKVSVVNGKIVSQK